MHIQPFHTPPFPVTWQVDDVFTQLSRGLPTYKWLTAMPQLVSRICHRSPKVVEPLKRILVQILQDHPQQALWSMAAVSKSTLDTRMKVATQIIQLARKGLRTNQDIDLFEKVGGRTLPCNCSRFRFWMAER